ncbi:MAG: hypothetical protein HC834_01470 [Rhodospirillales bacterium]|nr:hypothetical protein [Rhodospirillales bacterium]
MSEAPDVANSMWRYGMSLWRALDRERLEFFEPFRIAAVIAFRAAREEPPSIPTWLRLLQYNATLLNKATWANQQQLSDYLWDECQKGWQAWFNSLYGMEGESFDEFAKRQADVMEGVANFHEQVEKVKDQFGFHLRRPEYKLIKETPSFLMYQVLPLKSGVNVRDDIKPMLLVSPYMLGSHILSFLPYDDKSYAHAFANAGVPTYVRIVKDIWETESVQTLTPEDDCTETHELCTELVHRHGRKVTLNGTCQGGYMCLMNLLSGRYGDVCDTLITNVTPVDGTYSQAIYGLPQMNFDFFLSRMPNGNYVANGYLLSLGMRLVAIDRETPLIQVINRARLYETNGHSSKSTAALFRWLRKERVHLPPAIAKMSSISFQQPIGADGSLPVTLFGKPLKIGDLATLGVRWYQNYAVKDDLVTPPCATAGNRFLEGSGLLESVPFPGGHVAILTSPHSKRSPVDGRFEAADGTIHRGPVLFQLEISRPQAVMEVA